MKLTPKQHDEALDAVLKLLRVMMEQLNATRQVLTQLKTDAEVPEDPSKPKT